MTHRLLSIVSLVLAGTAMAAEPVRVATLLPYVFSSAAWLKLGKRGRIVAALALLYSLYALIGTGANAMAWVMSRTGISLAP